VWHQRDAVESATGHFHKHLAKFANEMHAAAALQRTIVLAISKSEPQCLLERAAAALSRSKWFRGGRILHETAPRT
jgi:hypothetical protein